MVATVVVGLGVAGCVAVELACDGAWRVGVVEDLGQGVSVKREGDTSGRNGSGQEW